MNYNQLVVSKNPTIYVPYNDGTDNAQIGSREQSYLTYLNPVYDSNFKKYGSRSLKVGASGAGNYDYSVYAPTGVPGYVGTVNYYYHSEFWVYFTAQPVGFTQGGSIYYRQVSPSGTYALDSTIRFNSNLTLAFNGNDLNVTSTSSVPVGKWTHVAVQYDYGVKRIYIDGVLDVEVNTGSVIGVKSVFSSVGSGARVTTYFDEFAIWCSTSTTKPANFPTSADILERATFPTTKTRYWNATTSQWTDSNDEQYWDGTQWISMQDLPYKVWNGTEWVAL